MKEALYYEKGENGKVHCELCPQNCIVCPGKTGMCRARKNIGGTLYSLNYGQVTAASLDPIEKKPLYHFYPNSYIFSIGSFGCNLTCEFCQNYSISQMGEIESREAEHVCADPEALVLKAKGIENNIGIAFTYNEPSIWYEFVLETAKKAKENGLKVVMVTNGYIQEKPLMELLPFIDAMNIDIKAFSQSFYGAVCSGNLEQVKRTIEICAKSCHLELTNLVIDTLNNDKDEFISMVNWIADINEYIPLHLSRYFPNYKMQLPKTAAETLISMYNLAKERLKYVYIGNVFELQTDTYCPDCGNVVVKRNGYIVDTIGLKRVDGEGLCSKCGEKIIRFS